MIKKPPTEFDIFMREQVVPHGNTMIELALDAYNIGKRENKKKVRVEAPAKRM